MRKLIATVAAAAALGAGPAVAADAPSPARLAALTTATTQDAACVEACLCPLFAALGAIFGNIPGVFEITDEGDIFIFGEWFWNCPPY